MMLNNPNPVIYETAFTLNNDRDTRFDWDEKVSDEFTVSEIYNHIRHINDPEHPLTLEQLNVVNPQHIYLDLTRQRVRVDYTPTIPHCSMATLIGLCIRVKLGMVLPKRMMIQVRVRENSHNNELAINKQLRDKERVMAALENESLFAVVQQCLSGPPRPGIAL